MAEHNETSAQALREENKIPNEAQPKKSKIRKNICVQKSPDVLQEVVLKMREQKEICALLDWGDFLLVTVQLEAFLTKTWIIIL